MAKTQAQKDAERQQAEEADRERSDAEAAAKAQADADAQAQADAGPERAPDDQLATAEGIESPDSAPVGGPGAPAAGVASSGGGEGTLTVDVKANLNLAGVGQLEVNQTEVTVPDTPEVRACIASGYLRLSDDKE